MSPRSSFAVVFLILIPCSAQQSLPPAVSRAIDFSADVHPLLVSRCAGCHTGDKPQAGLRMNTRAEMLQGGISGPAIVPGSSETSLLIHRVSGTKPPIMPIVGDRLTNDEIGILRAWIDQGAKIGQPPAARTWKSLLAPRRPEPPKGVSQSTNPLDAFLAVYFKRNGISPPSVVSDEAFVRRAYMDLWGMPPGVAERAAFLRDTRPDKRAALVKALLANRQHFSEHWISFWNDLLHNDEGVTYIGERKSITPWLLEALRKNLPYQEMVRALLNPPKPDGPEGFLMGVNWRGDINASQTPVMQAAQNSSQVFLGVNLKCNSCHDSFISNWKLKDAYGMASFFSEERLELVRCDVKTGEISSPKFLFTDLGSVEPDAPLEKRLAVAADLFTKRENGRFARTFVNRIWEKLMGRGLVEPVDDMDAEPFDSDVLDWLAYEFAEQDYDIDWLLAQIMSSQAYQLPAVASGEPAADAKYVFRGPQYRRLTAEQFVDSISAITGEWRVLGSTKPEPGVYSREWRFKASALTRALGRPTRDLAVTERTNDPTTLQLLELVNGRTLSEMIRRASLRMLGELPPAPDSLYDSGVVAANPVNVDVDITAARELRLVLVDHDSYDVSRVVAGWADATLDGASGTQQLAELPIKGEARTGTLEFRGAEPKQGVIAEVPSELVFDIARKGFTRFRATVGSDKSSLSSDINPRVRFYVFSAKPDYERLGRVTGAPPVAFVPEKFTVESLTSRVFLHALSRAPNSEERKVAAEYLKGAGGKLSADGLEDLLWSIFLSPEFQFFLN